LTLLGPKQNYAALVCSNSFFSEVLIPDKELKNIRIILSYPYYT
jgi:hypothetical protein